MCFHPFGEENDVHQLIQQIDSMESPKVEYFEGGGRITNNLKDANGYLKTNFSEDKYIRFPPKLANRKKQSVNTEPANSQPPNSQPPNAQPLNTQPPNTQPPNTQPPNTQPPNTQPPNTQPPNTQPPNTQPPNTQPPNTQPANTQPPNTQPANTQPANTQPANTQPANTQPANTQPANTQPANTQPANTQPANTQPPNTQPPITEMDQLIARFETNFIKNSSWQANRRRILIPISQKMNKDLLNRHGFRFDGNDNLFVFDGALNLIIIISFAETDILHDLEVLHENTKAFVKACADIFSVDARESEAVAVVGLLHCESLDKENPLDALGICNDKDIYCGINQISKQESQEDFDQWYLEVWTILLDPHSSFLLK